MASPENRAMQEAMRNRPPPDAATPDEWRASFVTAYADFKVPEQVRRQSVHANGVDAEWFRVGGHPNLALLFFHGGGYLLGSSRSHQALIGELAVEAGVDTLAVNYRLAPENPFPAAVEDAVASYRYLLDEGYRPLHIAVAGDSAGGGLAAALLLALKEQGLPQPACAVLISGWYDLSMGLPSIRGRANLDPIVKPEDLEGLRDAYLAGQDPRAPLASPLYGDWTGAPPLLVQVGGHEILFDDSVEFAKVAKAAGADVTLEIAEECVHVYPQYSQLHPEGVEGVKNAAEFIRRHLPI
jgi:acetyl esterase/lipase